MYYSLNKFSFLLVGIISIFSCLQSSVKASDSYDDGPKISRKRLQQSSDSSEQDDNRFNSTDSSSLDGYSDDEKSSVSSHGLYTLDMFCKNIFGFLVISNPIKGTNIHFFDELPTNSENIGVLTFTGLPIQMCADLTEFFFLSIKKEHLFLPKFSSLSILNKYHSLLILNLQDFTHDEHKYINNSRIYYARFSLICGNSYRSMYVSALVNALRGFLGVQLSDSQKETLFKLPIKNRGMSYSMQVSQQLENMNLSLKFFDRFLRLPTNDNKDGEIHKIIPPLAEGISMLHSMLSLVIQEDKKRTSKKDLPSFNKKRHFGYINYILGKKDNLTSLEEEREQFVKIVKTCSNLSYPKSMFSKLIFRSWDLLDKKINSLRSQPLEAHIFRRHDILRLLNIIYSINFKSEEKEKYFPALIKIFKDNFENLPLTLNSHQEGIMKKCHKNIVLRGAFLQYILSCEHKVANPFIKRIILTREHAQYFIDLIITYLHHPKVSALDRGVMLHLLIDNTELDSLPFIGHTLLEAFNRNPFLGDDLYPIIMKTLGRHGESVIRYIAAGWALNDNDKKIEYMKRLNAIKIKSSSDVIRTKIDKILEALNENKRK